jgi:hypothetical protein
MTPPQPSVVVIDQAKQIICGNVGVIMHLGKFGYVQVGSSDFTFEKIPNLIRALQKVHDLAQEDQHGS